MVSSPSPDPSSTEINVEALTQQLRRKEGNWVAWGRACQALQKAGLSPQKIFEDTGFEPIQQNQIVVATQVYDSVLKGGATAAVETHYGQRGSDVLYELRILSQGDRARVAEFALAQGLDADTIKDIVKAVKEYSYRQTLPEHFDDTVGDAAAYYYWALARQQADLQARSRLIALGLRYAHSASARQQIEKLLTDFAVVKSRPAPSLPAYRLETDSELPALIPVAGALPLSPEAFQAVPVTLPEEPFGIVKFSGVGAWAPIPGWQVILRAEDPVGILAQVRQLPNVSNPNSEEQVLVVVDRSDRQWSDQHYYLLAAGDTVSLQWSETAPAAKVLGRLVLVMRPKRILDENYTRELYQFEE
ncbi:MAG: RuBisCO accumulation factor 1 [Leptolyngbya sp.]|nr:RuBisCO accumulation factor 1 [Leptolyngbya sp.]